VGEVTEIAWCHHTFNPWWGCVRVSPGCERCYAETWDKARGGPGGPHWGVTAPRRFFGDKHWAEPIKWNRAAEKAGEFRRVFCASMADVFEDRRDLDEQRVRLWGLIQVTQHLNWMLLTKRPENILRLGPERLPRNVWLGFTAEDQQRLDARYPHAYMAAKELGAAVLFVSAEPLLGPVQLGKAAAGVDLVIVGGESGAGARALDVGWARDLRDECDLMNVSFFMKQFGAKPVAFDPAHEWFDGTDFHTGVARLVLKDKKGGGDMSEWPADLQIRQMPA
jgi:protein gp37